MQVRAFAELVLELVGRSSQDFQVDRRVVLAAAEVIILGILREMIDAHKPLPNSYYKPYVMKVKMDTTFNSRYVEFDPPVMQIGDNEGLAYVGATQDEYDINSNYVLLKPNEISGMAGLEAQHLGGRVGVRPEGGTRGYLYGEHPLITEVRVLMIPEVSKLKDGDAMFGLDLKPKGVVETDYVLKATVSYILGKRGFVEDKKTDGASN